MADRYPEIFKGGGGSKMSKIGIKGLIYEASESGFGTIEYLGGLQIYEFFDIIQYLRIKQAEIIKQQKKK